MTFELLLSDIEKCILNDDKTLITTVTNSGYVLYTLNMLKSLVPFGLDKKILIICMYVLKFVFFIVLHFSLY